MGTRLTSIEWWPIRAMWDLTLGVITVLSLVVGCWALLDDGSAAQTVMAVALSLSAIGLVILSFSYLRAIGERKERSSRADKWSDSLSLISDASLLLSRTAVPRHNNTKIKTEGIGGFSAQATEVCRVFGAAFRAVTGVDCRVTLKEIYVPEEEASGHNRPAVRNVTSVGSRERTPTAGGIDWVDENTDFKGIVEGARSHYFSNDIFDELRKGYRNSHWGPDVLSNPKSGSDLPYAATIVWPIRSQVSATGAEPVWSTIGFLCVDCREVGSFDPKLDVVMGEIVAQGFYSAWPTEERIETEG